MTLARDAERRADWFVYRPVTDAQRRAYDALGYLLLGRVLTDEGLRVLRRECTAIWENDRRRFDPSASSRRNILLSDVHRMSEPVRRYFYDGPLVGVAEAVIGPNIKGAATQLSFKMRGNTQRVPWHQDNGYGELDPANSITTLTALEDSDEENGCLWIVPGFHERGLRARYEHGAPDRDIELPLEESAAIPVPLRAGEALVIHCLTPHKSEANRSASRDRRLLFMRYADADAVEVYNGGRPRLGRLLRGVTRFAEVEAYESELS